MEPKLDHIRKLVQEYNWSGSELARKMGVSRSEANRFLNGQRKGGKKLISGLLQAFPNESIDTLFILPRMEPLGYIESLNATHEIPEAVLSSKQLPFHDCQKVKLKPVRHPNAHQLACSINEENGIIQILEGKNLTTLLVPTGPIEVRHSTKKTDD